MQSKELFCHSSSQIFFVLTALKKLRIKFKNKILLCKITISILGKHKKTHVTPPKITQSLYIFNECEIQHFG